MKRPLTREETIRYLHGPSQKMPPDEKETHTEEVMEAILSGNTEEFATLQDLVNGTVELDPELLTMIGWRSKP